MATTLEYKCPCCGGRIEFDPNFQKMRCPYCDTEFDVETLKSLDEELNKTAAPDTYDWSESAGGGVAGGRNRRNEDICLQFLRRRDSVRRKYRRYKVPVL